MTIINIIKKPSKAEAIAWLGINAEELREFCTIDDELLLGGFIHLVDDDSLIEVKTPSGYIELPLGWWVVKDEDGNLDVCDPSSFEDLYECQDVQISS